MLTSLLFTLHIIFSRPVFCYLWHCFGHFQCNFFYTPAPQPSPHLLHHPTMFYHTHRAHWELNPVWSVCKPPHGPLSHIVPATPFQALHITLITCKLLFGVFVMSVWLSIIFNVFNMYDISHTSFHNSIDIVFCCCIEVAFHKFDNAYIISIFRHRDSNPGRSGESRVS